MTQDTPEPVRKFMERGDVKHTLRLVPSSQRELFEYELRKHATTLYNDAVREERERAKRLCRIMLKTSPTALDTVYIKDSNGKIPVPKGNDPEDSYYNLALIELDEALTTPTDNPTNV